LQFLNNNINGFNYGLTGTADSSVFSNIAVGAYVEKDNLTSTGTNFALSAKATSISSGTNYGIYSIASNAITNFAGFFNGNVTVTGTFLNPSDLKLKTNIKKIENAMNVINKLNPVEYDYKKEVYGNKLNLPSNHQYGFIAQELKSVLPNLVHLQKLNLSTTGSGDISNKKQKNDSNEMIEFSGINYISLIPILVEGLKEQDNKINELTKQIEELKALIQK
jgi:hypothetical protein